MNCPKCGKRTAVVDSRPLPNNEVFRRRVCKECGFKFITIERRIG